MNYYLSNNFIYKIIGKITSNSINQTVIPEAEKYDSSARELLDAVEVFATVCREEEAEAKDYPAHTLDAQRHIKNAQICNNYIMICKNKAQFMTHVATLWRLSHKIHLYEQELLKETVDKAKIECQMAEIYESMAKIKEDMALLCDAISQSHQDSAKKKDELCHIFESMIKSYDRVSQICEVDEGQNFVFITQLNRFLLSQAKFAFTLNSQEASYNQKEASICRKDASLYRENIARLRINFE